MVKVMLQVLYIRWSLPPHQFVEAMERLVPFQVEIITANEVNNKYAVDPALFAVDPEHAKVVKPVPLFAVDVTRTHEGLNYSTELKKFVERVVGIFEEGLMRMKDQPVIEEVVMEHLFRRQGVRNMLKPPSIPTEEPLVPSQAEKNKGKLLGDNAWLWHLKGTLVAFMEKAIALRLI